MPISGSSLFALLLAALVGLPLVPTCAAELKAEGSIPGVSIVVQELKRDEANSVTLRFQMINASDKSMSLHGKFKESGKDGDQISGVTLIDNVNKKKYLVARDAAGKCACSVLGNLDKGARAGLWAKFAAPPENVDKITVVVPEFQPVDNVPITR